ncbi:unnamed protein product [Prunus brigantina]
MKFGPILAGLSERVFQGQVQAHPFKLQPCVGESIQLDQVKLVHYCANGSKPWRYTGKEENMEREDIKMLVKKWWDIYDDESLDFKNIVAAAEAGNGAE